MPYALPVHRINATIRQQRKPANYTKYLLFYFSQQKNTRSNYRFIERGNRSIHALNCSLFHLKQYIFNSNNTVLHTKCISDPWRWYRWEDEHLFWSQNSQSRHKRQARGLLALRSKRGLQLDQEWVLSGPRTTLPKCSPLMRRKILCMTGLQSPPAHGLQDQQMVGAICGLEDFLSNPTMFCLPPVLRWPLSITCAPGV